MATTTLTVPLAQAALHNDPKPSRPLPPSSRPLSIMPREALEPDRQLVDKPAPEAAEMAGSKKGRKRSPEAVAKFKATLARKKAAAAAAAAAGGEPIGRPKLDGLDLILDIIELAERAKKGLSKSQRARLRTALNERLS